MNRLPIPLLAIITAFSLSGPLLASEKTSKEEEAIVAFMGTHSDGYSVEK